MNQEQITNNHDDDLARAAVEGLADDVANRNVSVASDEQIDHDEEIKNETDTDNISVDDAKRAPTFAELGVPEPLVRVLAAEGKTTAFPIQADTLPDSLNGRDVLGRGKTGSGKTLAYALPLVARLSAESAHGADSQSGDDSAARNAKQGRGPQARGGSRSNTRMPQPRALVLAPTRELVNQIDEVISPLAGVYGIKTATI